MYEGFKKNWSNIIPIIISVIALFFSTYSHFENIHMQEKYDALNTYEMILNYQIKISNKDGEGRIKFNNKEISTGQINIIPKIGGIEKVYSIHYTLNNVKAILPMELYTKELENYDAQRFAYCITKYNIDNIAKKSDVYYGTLYLLIKDYQNNYYTNMIIYEFKKKDISQVKTRIYSDVDLLHTYNNDINVLPEFDAMMMKEYQSLKTKLNKILVN